MKLSTLAFLSLAHLTSGLAHAAAPDFTMTVAPNAGNLEVTAAPPAAHHFNIEAPMSLAEPGAKKPLKPKSATKDQVLFQLAGTQPRHFAVTLYLCDDANTYCEKHVVASKWDGKAAVAAPGSALPKTADITPAGSIFKGAAKQGFLSDPDKALELAARENKPLMISFFAVWCPPCNMLDHEVISSKEFSEAAKDFVKLRLDVDAEASWPLKARYQVGGYPTVVFANAKGDELLRVVGYRPKAEFLSELKTAWNLRTESLASLTTKADAGNTEAAQRIGLIHFERKEYKDAIRYLTKAGDADSRETALQAKLSIAEDEDDKGDQKKLLEQALKEFPDSPSSLPRQVELANLYKESKQPEKAKELFNAAIANGTALAKSPEKLAGHDLIVPDVLSYVAEAHEGLGDEQATRLAWKQVAAEYRKRIKDSSDRGNNLELGHALAKAGKIRQADEHFKKLEKLYPQDHSFYYNHAYMLYNTAKNALNAEPVAAKAYELAYGDNKIRAAMLLAKIRETQGNTKEALEVTEQTLKQVKLPEDKGNRTHRYVKQLKELNDKLAASLERKSG